MLVEMAEDEVVEGRTERSSGEPEYEEQEHGRDASESVWVL